jgi:hypothetical protein
MLPSVGACSAQAKGHVAWTAEAPIRLWVPRFSRTRPVSAADYRPLIDQASQDQVRPVIVQCATVGRPCWTDDKVRNVRDGDAAEAPDGMYNANRVAAGYSGIAQILRVDHFMLHTRQNGSGVPFLRAL